MAFVVGELVAPVSLDPKPFEKGLDETKKKGENWAQQTGEALSKAGTGMEKFGRGWTTGVTLPIVGAGAAVITTAASFESSMNRVKGLTGATGDEFDKLRDQARELGATTQYSASEAADGMGFLAMAGFKTNEILGAMPSVLELAASAQMDLASAADITSNILTGYGKNVGELGHVNDVLVKAMTSANVDLNMLGESLKYVGPVASGVGMDFEEVAAAVGLMGNAGIQGCYDGETDVLTKDGWKPWPAVTTEDEFATYNADTGEMEYQNATRLIQYRHTGKMYRVANLHIDLMVTPDHRMWVKRRGRENYEVLRAHELAGKTARYRAGGIKWKGADPQTYRVSGFEQDRASWVKNVPAVGIDAEVWATFLGWYISEGSCDYRDGNYRVRITQRPGATRDRMRQVLAKLPWPVFEGKNGFSIITEQLYRQVEPLGKTAEKHIPRYAKNWSPRLLNYLLVALLEGDGDANKAYYTSSQKLADDVSEIALKLGYATSVILRPYKTSIIRGRKVSPTGPQWKVNIRGSHLEPWYDPNAYKGVHGGRLNGARGGGAEEWVDFDGEVYCAEVPNHLLIVRRNGKVIVSGNSMAGTSLRQAITALINPTKQAKGIMQELRLEVTDSEGNLKSLTEIVGGLEESGATAADMMALFGQRAGPAMVSLVEQGSEALGDFTANLKDSEGAAKAIAEVNMQGAKGAFLELKSAGEELALSIADSGILEQITDIATSFANWLRETSKTNPELLKLGVNVALAAAAAGPLLSVTGKVSKGIGGILTLTGKLIPSLGGTATGLGSAGGAAVGAGTKFAALGAAAGPIALVAGGLIALAIIAKQNKDHFNDLTAEARELDRAMAGASSAFEDAQEKFDNTSASTIAAAELAEAYIDRLVELEEAGLDTAESQREYAGIVERLRELIPDINIELDEQTGLIVDGAGALRDQVQAWKELAIQQAMQEQVTEMVKAHTEALVELTKSKYRYAEIEEELNNLISGQAGVVKDLARELGISEEETRKMLDSSSKLNGLLSRSGAVGDLTEDYLHFGHSIGETRTKMEELAESIRDGETTAADLAEELNVTEQAVQDFLDALDSDPIEGTREKLGELDDEIVNAGENARTAAEGAGESIGQGMADGLDNKRKAVAAAAKGLADSATHQIRSTLQIASPSKVAIGWGKNIAEGLAIGMEDSGILQDASMAMADMIHLPQMATPQAAGNVSNTVPININVYGDVTKDTVTAIGDTVRKGVGSILQERGVVGGFR